MTAGKVRTHPQHVEHLGRVDSCRIRRVHAGVFGIEMAVKMTVEVRAWMIAVIPHRIRHQQAPSIGMLRTSRVRLRRLAMFRRRQQIVVQREEGTRTAKPEPRLQAMVRAGVEAVLVEADGPRVLAVGVLAVGYGAGGRRIAVHKAVAHRPAVLGTVVHVAACLVKVAVVMRMMLAVPLVLLAGVRGVVWASAVQVEGLPAASEAEWVFVLRHVQFFG